MNKDKTIVVRGELHWAKVVGKARPYTGNPKYDKGPYWSVDITPDAKSLEILELNGVRSKLKTPKSGDSRTQPYLALRVLENRKDGEKNPPPKIVDAAGEPWDNRLLGNGTIADIKIKVKDYGSGSELGTYLRVIRVLDLVEYESNDFDAIDEDDEYFNKAKAAPKTAQPADDEDLDDDVPF